MESSLAKVKTIQGKKRILRKSLFVAVAFKLVASLSLLAFLLPLPLASAAEMQNLPPGVDTTLLPPVPPQEDIPFELPKISKLMPIGAKMPPIRLEATFTEPITLKEALQFAMDNNLSIRIFTEGETSYRWLWIGSTGKFLPNWIWNYQQQKQQGSTLVGGVIPTAFNNPFVSTYGEFQFPAFQGGAAVFGTMLNWHNWKAAQQQVHQSYNDTLLSVGNGYYNLLLQEALLEIRIRAVDSDKTQVDLNEKLEHAGTGTHFNVLQSQTQLASDEQALLSQEVAVRTAALNLATTLNLDLGVNLVCVDNVVKKVRLVDPDLGIGDLINIAVKSRPELKQFEHLRLAARRNIQVQAAPLYPQVNLFGEIAGNGDTLSKTTEVVPGALETIPTTGPAPGVPIPGPGGKAPIGAAAAGDTEPIFPVFGTGDIFVPPHIESRQIRASYYYGFQIQWQLPGMGLGYAGNVRSAKALARQALLNENQQLLNVLNQVRTDYLNTNLAERQIDVASIGVVSSTEQLRLSEVRLANGVGTNIDVVTAQQAWEQALVNKAQAVIQFNQAQVQLVHDLGIPTVDNLLGGHLIGRSAE
jgi:outer membrane protein TolC